ncbi:hypothetical protein CKO51_26540 [Rhodopirellula sp. SM50]|nr:hypothetical protein CKO51_26540 [Rhodopirellula sp. SM50]
MGRSREMAERSRGRKMGATERRGDRKIGDKKMIRIEPGGIIRGGRMGVDEIEGLKHCSPSIVRRRGLVT